MISSESDCELLKSLIGHKMIGMDSEWRPSMTKFNLVRPAIF